MKGIEIRSNRIYATKDHQTIKEGTEGGIIEGVVYLDEFSWVEAGSSIVNNRSLAIRLYNSVVKGNSIIHNGRLLSEESQEDVGVSLLFPQKPSILLNSIISGRSSLKVATDDNELHFNIVDSILNDVGINCEENYKDVEYNFRINKSRLNNVKMHSYISHPVSFCIWESEMEDLEFHFKAYKYMGDFRVFNSVMKNERYMFRNYAKVRIYNRTSLGLEQKNILYANSNEENNPEITLEGDSFEEVKIREL